MLLGDVKIDSPNKVYKFYHVMMYRPNGDLVAINIEKGAAGCDIENQQERANAVVFSRMQRGDSLEPPTNPIQPKDVLTPKHKAMLEAKEQEYKTMDPNLRKAKRDAIAQDISKLRTVAK